MRTGYISPQFHVVFDETFETVASDGTIDLTENWIDLFLNSRESFLDGFDPEVDGELPTLDSEWQAPDGSRKQDELAAQSPPKPVDPQLPSQQPSPKSEGSHDSGKQEEPDRRARSKGVCFTIMKKLEKVPQGEDAINNTFILEMSESQHNEGIDDFLSKVLGGRHHLLGHHNQIHKTGVVAGRRKRRQL